MIPVSTQAVKLSALTHRILCICDMSKETIIRVSDAGHKRAPVTLVPPPNGIKTTSCSQAERKKIADLGWVDFGLVG